MDTRLDKILKTEQEKHPSLRQAVLDNLWDSVESDTESLAQERAYQQQLQMCIDQNKYIPIHKENADSLQHGDGEDEDGKNETEDIQIYDNLEVEARPHAKRNSMLVQTKFVDTQIDEREVRSPLLSDDAYSDLRYDPNWRTNLKGADCFRSPQISIEEYYQVPKEKSSQACGDRHGLLMKGGYRYVFDTSPAVVVTPRMASNESDQSYHLHPQDGQNSSVASPHCHNCALQLRPSETDLSRPSSIFTKNESDNTSQKGFRKKCEDSCDNVSRSPELTDDVHAMYVQECKTYQQQELRHTQGGLTQTQHMSTSALSSLKVLANKKADGLKEDIVERNKITLGRNTSKSGSYVMAHTLKQDMPRDVHKVDETLKDRLLSTECQEDSSDPKLRWLQTTQQLRVTQISEGKKEQQKEYASFPKKKQPPALGVRAGLGDCLSSPLTRPVAVTQPKPQRTTLSQPFTPTFPLNINLNTSSHLLPLLQQSGQEATINIESLHGCPHWNSTSQAELAFSSGYQQTKAGKSSKMSQKGVNLQSHHQNLESIPEQWQRTIELKRPLTCEWEDQKRSPKELHSERFPQNPTRTPNTTSSMGSSSYTVLPPIGKPMTGKGPELSPGQNVNTACSIHRSSSDGYLVQMEKQRQLRASVTYKAYSLKDYKQLKSDLNLRGLGPDYKAIEKTKMKRQRLYSNVIREQNKKISRIPSLPAKDLEGSDKKVPRMKALEYAKTIAKPLLQSQPKQRQKHQSEGFTERTPYLEGLYVSQPATLEILRKRHEEEKKAVALFRKVHAV